MIINSKISIALQKLKGKGTKREDEKEWRRKGGKNRNCHACKTVYMTLSLDKFFQTIF